MGAVGEKVERPGGTTKGVVMEALLNRGVLDGAGIEVAEPGRIVDEADPEGVVDNANPEDVVDEGDPEGDIDEAVSDADNGGGAKVGPAAALMFVVLVPMTKLPEVSSATAVPRIVVVLAPGRTVAGVPKSV